MSNSVSRYQETWRTIGIVLIPIVIGIIGYVNQSNIARNTVQAEYVKLAISILGDTYSEPKEPLRVWAGDIFLNYSPIKFSSTTIEKLVHGDIRFPNVLTDDKGNILTDNKGNPLTY